MNQTDLRNMNPAERPVARLQGIDPARLAPPRPIAAIDAFATRIEAFSVPDSDALNRDLAFEIDRLRRTDAGLTVSNRDGWHSANDFFAWQQPCFVTLQAHFMAAITSCVRHYWPAYDPDVHLTTCEGWANVHERGGFNVPHDHSDNHLSACYYVTVPKTGDKQRESIIEFLNPAGALSQFMGLGHRMVHPSVRIEPEPGQLLVFPSYLKHWVHPNRADGPRVSIAVNALVREAVLEPIQPA